MTVSACRKAVAPRLIENPQMKSMLCSLPEEVIENIILNLDGLTDRYHLTLACRKLYRITGSFRLRRVQRKVCEHVFASRFPLRTRPDPSIWQSDPWLAMRMNRQWFSDLFAQTYSPQDMAAMDMDEDVCSMQHEAVKQAWKCWLAENVKSGCLSIPFHLNFTNNSLVIFLEALAARRDVAKLQWRSPLSEMQASQLGKFIEKEGDKISSLNISPICRSATLGAVKYVIKSLQCMPNLVHLTLDNLPYSASLLRELSLAVHSSKRLKELHLNVYPQILSKRDWKEMAWLFQSNSLNHLWIEGMNDLGLECIGPFLMETRVPKISFRCGFLTASSEQLLKRLVRKNPYLKLLDLACNNNLHYEEIPELVVAVQDRPELCFGISGGQIQPVLSIKKSRIRAKRH